MDPKRELHSLVDRLPDGEQQSALRFLKFLCGDNGDPLLATLMTAPVDDEPETPEETAAVKLAWEQLARGETVSDEELWKRLGHEPPR